MAFGQIVGGAQPRGYNSASGGVPGVTSPVDAITGNLGGLGNIINSITGQQSSALRTQYPDEYFSTLGTLLGNTQRRAAGDISDLLPELQQNSAEDAVYGGMSGSGAENTKLLRDLGLTRYGVQNEAINSLGKIQGQIPTVRPFDPSAIINEQLAAQERADMYASAPVPEDAYQRAIRAAMNMDYKGWKDTPGKTYRSSGGGGGGGAARPFDSVMRGYGLPTIGYGTRQDTSQGSDAAPWGTQFSGGLPKGFWDSPTTYGDGGDSQDFNDYLSTDYGPQSRQSDDEWLASIFGE